MKKITTLITGLSIFLCGFTNAVEEPVDPPKEEANRIKVFDEHQFNYFFSLAVMQASITAFGNNPVPVFVYKKKEQPSMQPTTVTLTKLKATVNGITAVCSDAALAKEVKKGNVQVTLKGRITTVGSSNPNPQDEHGHYKVQEFTIDGAVKHDSATLEHWGPAVIPFPGDDRPAPEEEEEEEEEE